MPSTWIMNHGTAAPARNRVPADGSPVISAPPAVRVRGVRRSFEAEAIPVRALQILQAG